MNTFFKNFIRFSFLSKSSLSVSLPGSAKEFLFHYKIYRAEVNVEKAGFFNQISVFARFARETGHFCHSSAERALAVLGLTRLFFALDSVSAGFSKQYLV